MFRIVCTGLAFVALTGCSAQLAFVDRTNGLEYMGTTGGTMSGEGEVTAVIEATQYKGRWIYSADGGSVSFGNSIGTTTAMGSFSQAGTFPATFSGAATSFSTANLASVSAKGSGMMNMRSDSGDFIRCLFAFNVMTNTGIGECQRNDGRTFDMRLKR